MTTAMQPRTTEQVIQGYLQARRKGDIAAMIGEYAVGAVAISPLGVYRGTDGIRRFVSTMAELLPPGCEFNLDKEIMEGEIGYLVWKGESRLCVFPYVSETLVIRQGQILAHTLAGIIEDKE